MDHRLLTGLALAPLTFALMSVAADAVSGRHASAEGKVAAARRSEPVSAPEPVPVPVPEPVERAASASEPGKHAADSVGSLAAAMVAGAAAAFAGTATARRRQGVQR